jgi:hypothetical protein
MAMEASNYRANGFIAIATLMCIIPGMYLLWMGSDEFVNYMWAGPDGNIHTGLLQITSAQFESLQSLFLTISK